MDGVLGESFGMLTVADLEVNVLEFCHRTFQFERVVERDGGPFALFSRTETESERQLRPKLVRLTLVAPLAWVVVDPVTDSLRLTASGAIAPTSPDGAAAEVAAEPPEFDADGARWKRVAVGPGYVYAPWPFAPELLAPSALAALGVG